MLLTWYFHKLLMLLKQSELQLENQAMTPSSVK